MTTDQEKFEARVKTSLDASLVKLDKKTQHDLATIRQSVLKPQQARSWFSFNTWAPAGALAFCALLTVFLLYNPHNIDDTTQQIAVNPNIKNEPVEQIAMIELLIHPDDLESVTDPDFYVWIDEVLATEGADNAV